MTRLPNAVPKPDPRSKRPRKPVKQGRVRTVNASRRKKEFARAYGSKERVAWVASQNCIGGCISRMGGYKIDNAHIPTRSGMGRKGDYTQIIPLCRLHHRLLHEWGARRFLRHFFPLNPEFTFEEWAAFTERRWLAYQETAK